MRCRGETLFSTRRYRSHGDLLDMAITMVNSTNHQLSHPTPLVAINGDEKDVKIDKTFFMPLRSGSKNFAILEAEPTLYTSN